MSEKRTCPRSKSSWVSEEEIEPGNRVFLEMEIEWESWARKYKSNKREA